MDLKSMSADQLCEYKAVLSFIDNNPPTKCSKNEFIEALQSVDEALFNKLFEIYKASSVLQFHWATVNELDRNHPTFIRFVNDLHLTDELLNDIFHVVGVRRLEKPEEYSRIVELINH